MSEEKVRREVRYCLYLGASEARSLDGRWFLELLV